VVNVFESLQVALKEEIMDGGKGGSAPAAPDYAQLARDQGLENRRTAQFNAAINRINEYTPYGSRVFTRVPGTGRTFNQSAYDSAMRDYNARTGAHAGINGQLVGGMDTTGVNPGTTWAGGGLDGGVAGGVAGAPRMEDFYVDDDGSAQWQATTSFSPEQQKLFEQDMRLRQQFGNTAEGYMGRVNAMLGQEIPDFAGDRQRVEAALFDRMRPELDRNENAMRQRLANQGIGINSEAYGTETSNYGDIRNRAMMEAILNAGKEQSRLVNQALQLRQVPLNEMNALRTGSQVTLPQFQAYNNSISAAPANIYGAGNDAYNAQMNQYNADVAGDNAMMSGLFGLGSSFLTGGMGGGLFGLGGMHLADMGMGGGFGRM
jgi:hypothetical protein